MNVGLDAIILMQAWRTTSVIRYFVELRICETRLLLHRFSTHGSQHILIAKPSQASKRNNAEYCASIKGE